MLFFLYVANEGHLGYNFMHINLRIKLLMRGALHINDSVC